ncbi:MAG TPA: UvrD-helicase domain-containing protein, partial [Candidatus Kryptobacter bacterium]
MTELTDQQKKALELDKHISVTANAGSGKTRVLVERYVSAARSGVKVEQILCLTFTEKAALELREKIGARINAEFQAERKSGSAYAASLRDARHKMLEANISTIHSFCSRVLREFPIEAGIDANFKVLEDFDASSLKEDACAEAIRDSLAAERPGASPAQTERNVHNLLVRIGYGKILVLLIQLLDNREKIEHARITGKKIHPDEETVRRHWFNLARAVADVIRLNVSRKKGDFSAEVNALSDTVAGDAGDLMTALVELKATLDKILTQSGTP